MQSDSGVGVSEEIFKIISTAKENDDPFAILGLTPDATEQEIRRSYRRLAMQLHPDKNRNFQPAEEAFKYVSQAYKQILDMSQPSLLIQQVLQVNPNEPIKFIRRNGTNVYQNTDTETYKRYSQLCNNLLKKLSHHSSFNGNCNNTKESNTSARRKWEDEENAEILLNLKRQKVIHEPSNNALSSDNECSATDDGSQNNRLHAPSRSVQFLTATKTVQSYSPGTEKSSLSESETESDNELSISFSSDKSCSILQKRNSSHNLKETNNTNVNLPSSTVRPVDGTNSSPANCQPNNNSPMSTHDVPTSSSSSSTTVPTNNISSHHFDINDKVVFNSQPYEQPPSSISEVNRKVNKNNNNNTKGHSVSRRKQPRKKETTSQLPRLSTTNEPKTKVSLSDIRMFIDQKLRQLRECADENVKRQEALILGLQQRFLCKQTALTSDSATNSTTTTTVTTARISTTTFTHQGMEMGTTIHKSFSSAVTPLPSTGLPRNHS